VRNHLLLGRNRVPVVLIALFLSAFIAGHAISLDGIDGMLFQAAFDDGSEWAPGYSALGFWRVRRGMTPDEVLALVGEPLERYEVRDERGLTGWRWTRNPLSTHHKVRVVLFRNDRVVEKLSLFYLD